MTRALSGDNLVGYLEAHATIPTTDLVDFYRAYASKCIPQPPDSFESLFDKFMATLNIQISTSL